MPRYVLPATILVLFFLAFAFRWETEQKMTRSSGTIIVFEHDRWTGQHWVNIYKPSEIIVRPLGDSSSETTAIATGIWIVFTVSSLIWLLLSSRKPKPQAKGEEGESRNKDVPWKKIGNKTLVVLGVLFLVYIGVCIVVLAFGIGS